MTKEEATILWMDANSESCCSCHLNPPCSFCVDGYSLDLNEYLSLLEECGDIDEVEQVSDHITDYERAMKGI